MSVKKNNERDLKESFEELLSSTGNLLKAISNSGQFTEELKNEIRSSKKAYHNGMKVKKGLNNDGTSTIQCRKD